MSAPRPARVVHYARALGPGGTEKTLQILASGLDRDRFQPVVLALEDGPRRRLLQEAGVEVRVSPDPLPVLQRLRPDIVHVHRAGWPEPDLMRPLKLARVLRVVETNVFGRHDPSPLGRLAHRILFVSEFCRRRYGLVHSIDVEGPRYDVLYNPVRTDAYAHVEPDFSRPVVGRISRADPGKWSPLAMDMLPRLLAEVPEARYRVIGGTKEARARACELGVAETVDWLDPVLGEDELAAFLAGCSVFAHANAAGESFGMVIAEAMAAGLPVITHPSEGLRDNAQLELVEHDRTGLVAATAEEYGQAVAWLLRHPEHARAMGRAGREKARRLYDARAVVARLEEIYDRVLAQPTSHGVGSGHGRGASLLSAHPGADGLQAGS
ncbi:glycosyltransferase family 4 protein [Desulfohalovibrio reitneri]|uniref:glycosyltransferase family 4 protein n=1 Tax=Desulfohalovibrio reitneri TaxID=1307759 RepID=UPI0009E0104B|nr:glycosyltransferase family 4 protein [Desulfohalovibrio reitneri]